MIILVLLITLPLVILIYFLQKSRKPSVLKTLVPPGPPGLPLIGNLHQLAAAKVPHVYLWKLSKKYGSLMKLKLGSIPILVVSSADLAEQVLKTQDLAFCSRPKFLGQQKLSYNAKDIVFAPYNDYWREVRKITAIHLFSIGKVQSYRFVREEEISRTVAMISSSINFASSGDPNVVNMSDISMALSSTLICRIAFGRRCDDRGSGIRRFDELLHEIQALVTSFYVSDYFPKFGWVDNFSGLINRLDSTFEKLDAFYQELIDEHLDPSWRAKKRDGDDDDDILDTLIKLKEHKSSSIDLEWDHIKALLMNIFIAAMETSSASIVWTMTALMKAPNVMEKVQQEIRNSTRVLEKGKVDEDDLPKLIYLKAVIKESLRLYPPVPLLLPRETIERCTLEGYQVEPKTVVYVNAWAIARDPENWENPDEFFPERFLTNNNIIDVKGQDFGVIPFGSGRRICPGMHMGLATVELAVANLLYSFDWDLPPGIQPQDVDTDVLPGISMQKKNPLVVVPKKYVV